MSLKGEKVVDDPEETINLSGHAQSLQEFESDGLSETLTQLGPTAGEKSPGVSLCLMKQHVFRLHTEGDDTNVEASVTRVDRDPGHRRASIIMRRAKAQSPFGQYQAKSRCVTLPLS